VNPVAIGILEAETRSATAELDALVAQAFQRGFLFTWREVQREVVHARPDLRLVGRLEEGQHGALREPQEDVVPRHAGLLHPHAMYQSADLRMSRTWIATWLKLKAVVCAIVTPPFVSTGAVSCQHTAEASPRAAEAVTLVAVRPTDRTIAADVADEVRRPASFLADENFSLSLVKALRGHGCSITTVQEVGLVKKPDAHNWDWARRRARVLLTQDHDFVEEWRFPVQDGPGLGYFPQLMGAEAQLLAVRVMTGFARSGDPLQAMKLLFETDGSLILRTGGPRGALTEVPLRFDGSAREITRQIAAFMQDSV